MTEANEAPPLRSAGSLLAAEREKQGLSRADVAQRLCMSASQVEALEAGDFSRLATGPFLKGFVRNYARLLGMDAEAVVSLVLRDLPAAPLPALAVPSQGIRFEPFSRRWSPAAMRASIVAMLVLVAGIGSLYWWLNVYPAKPMPVAEPAATLAPAELPGMAPPVAAPAPESLALSLPPSEATPAATPLPAGSAPAAQAPSKPLPAEALPAASNGLSRLRLVTRERTWIEVIDRSGTRVASRNVEPGAAAEFVGQAPLRVAIGNAPGTRLLFNDREVDLAPHTRAAVARLILE